MEPVYTFAERLAQLKVLKGFSNTDIAKICKIDKSNVTRYCKGEYKAKQDVIYRMAEKLGIDEAWLMGYDVPMYKDKALSDTAKKMFKGDFFGETKKEPVILSFDELGKELIKHLMELSPEELAKVDAFVQGLLASR